MAILQNQEAEKKYFNGNNDRVFRKSQCDSCCHHTEVVKMITLFVQQRGEKVQVAKLITINLN